MQRSRRRFWCLINLPNDCFSAVYDLITSYIKVSLRRQSCDRHRRQLDRPDPHRNDQLTGTSKISILNAVLTMVARPGFGTQPDYEGFDLFCDVEIGR